MGSLFSADAWNNITFTAGEVKNPRRDIPVSLAVGTAIVITLYFLANLGYLSTLTLHQIQTAPDDRVATATLAAIFGNSGATLMALAIMISTFGCANGLILAGARVYYAMSRDGLFFRSIGKLNANHVPAMGLVLQGIWAAILVLLRTRLVNATTGAVTYGNLYGVLLDYVIFAVLMFYVLTIGGLFVLRRKRPDAERPYRAWGYPVVPILYIVTALIIMLILILYQTQDTWPGLVIVLLGVPVYWAWSRQVRGARSRTGFSLSGIRVFVSVVTGRQAEACRYNAKVAMANQLFQMKTHEALLEELHGENRLRRVLGPVQLSSLGVGAIIGTGIFVLTGVAAHDLTGPALMLSFVVSGHDLHFRGAVLRGIRLHGARGGIGLHLCLRDAGRTLRLDHRLGPDSRIRRGVGHGGARLVALLSGFSAILPRRIAACVHECAV